MFSRTGCAWIVEIIFLLVRNSVHDRAQIRVNLLLLDRSKSHMCIVYAYSYARVTIFSHLLQVLPVYFFLKFKLGILLERLLVHRKISFLQFGALSCHDLG